jgi:hypothetical protein
MFLIIFFFPYIAGRLQGCCKPVILNEVKDLGAQHKPWAIKAKQACALQSCQDREDPDLLIMCQSTL